MLFLNELLNGKNRKSLQIMEKFSEIGVYDPAGERFIYKEPDYKLYFNSETRTFGIVGNDMSREMTIILSAIPIVNDFLTLKIRTAGIPELNEISDIVLKKVRVIKRLRNRYWLWSDERNLGFIIIWIG